MPIELKKNINALKEKTSKKVKVATEAMINYVDQNDDGKLDINDVTVVKDAINEGVKDASDKAKQYISEKKLEAERRQLKPIFESDIDSSDFMMPKIIRISEMDKKHQQSEVCNGSIGYYAENEGLRIINIYPDYIHLLGVTFYPDLASEVYYVNPTNHDNYIALNDYYQYLKVARVNELQKIAQDLGATHFKVTLKEKKVLITKKNLEAEAGFKTRLINKNEKAGDNDLKTSINYSTDDFATIEVSAEMDCEGHAPVEPSLNFLKRDLSVQNLISMRMDTNNHFKHQKISIELANTSGIREKDAIKIDALLEQINISGGVTLTNETKQEERRFLEYEIFF